MFKVIPLLKIQSIRDLFIQGSVKHCLALLTLVLLCGDLYAQSPMFQVLSPKVTNIKFSNNINETEDLNVLAYEYFYNGGGVAVGDINNDGLEDVFLTANMKPNKLYLNLGGMKFKDITTEASKDLEGKKDGWKTGVTMADVDGDGLLDIYVCYSGKVSDDTRRNQLFINKGNLKFEEQARQFGLDDKSYSTQAAFFDFDNDGDLDMFLLNHSVKKISNLELAKFRAEIDSLAGDKLYRNDGGHFTDVSAKAGLHQNPLTFGLGIAVADINNDGWQDVYVTNDYNEPDYLYISNRDGTFTDKTRETLSHLAQFSMGVEIADYNNDGLPDIFNLDMLPEDNRRQKLLQLQENYESFQLMIGQGLQKQYMHNMLQLNNGDGTFSEIAQAVGISNTDWSWCPLLADFDNDGFKDLFITNGYLRDYTNKDFLTYRGDYKLQKAIKREPFRLMDLVTAMPSTTLENYIYKNNGDLTFTNMKESWGMNIPGISSGAIYADLDNDGDLDLLVNRVNDNAALYKNMRMEQQPANYLAVKLSYANPNINAVGAKIYLYANETKQYIEVNPNRGYLSCVSTTAHFGLGNHTTVDSLKIIWPDHSIQVIKNIKSNQLMKVAFNKSETEKVLPAKSTSASVFTSKKSIINYSNQSFNENDFKRQPLMLFMYSKTGPVMVKGDVNNDGLSDLFLSGDKDKAGKIYVQQKDGTYKILPGLNIGDENVSAVSAAAFFDANGDGFNDLYVAKGGYSLFEPNTPSLQDELYLNDGKGNLKLSPVSLPVLTASSKSCVRPCDYDNDGDIDLFVGGRVIPGQYPLTPISYLLTNNGKGEFLVTQVPFSKIGMVSDAQWVDLNNDGRMDLVMCGEFMPVSIFLNGKDGFVNETVKYFDKPDNGLWFTLTIADVNNDGKPDIIAGNSGLNMPLHFSDEEPAELYYADFDGNGSIDPFFNGYVQGKSYPFVSRDELNDQIYGMRKKFTSFKDYANATMTDIFTNEELAKASKLTATEARSVCYINRNGRFEKTVLPLPAQFSVVTKIIADDFNKDGKMDLLLLGNRSDNRLKIGSIDANRGCLLAGDGEGNFKYIDQAASGLSVKGDVKSALVIDVNNQKQLLVGVADGPLQMYQLN